MTCNNMRWKLANIIGLSLTIWVLGSFSCQQDPTPPSQVMKKFYINHKWIPLDMPDSRFRPGTIFTYTKKTGIRYVSSLKTCGVPEDVSASVQGHSGALKFECNSQYGADAVLKVAGVSAGPEFSKVKKTTVKLTNHGPSSLDLYKLQIWLTSPENASAFSQVCKDGLDRPDTFIVQEAYLVSKGEFTLYDATDAKIGIQGLNMGPISIDPSARVQASGDGSLQFEEPLYTAIRRVRRINGGFESLGASTQARDADEEILRDMQE